MINLKKVNVYRRAIMHSLTKNIGKTNYKKHIGKDVQIKYILISRPNHRLGNMLLLTPLVQEVTRLFPESKVDLFVRGNMASIIFKNFNQVDRIIALPKKPFSNLFQYIKCWLSIRNKKYDIVINAIPDSSSGKLSTLFSNAQFKLYGENNEDSQMKYSDYSHMAKLPVYNFRNFLKQLSFDVIDDKIPTLSLKLDKQEIDNGAQILNSLVSKNKKKICLFTNATGDKCYSETWWNKFYETLKFEFPEYEIIELLPIENKSKLGLKIPYYYSTDIREMGSFIANVNLFIAADCGVMHLSSAIETSTIGLFSVTKEHVYKPYGNKSLAINTNNVNYNEMIELINIYLKNPFPKKSIY